MVKLHIRDPQYTTIDKTMCGRDSYNLTSHIAYIRDRKKNKTNYCKACIVAWNKKFPECKI